MYPGLILTSVAAVALEDSVLEDIRRGQYKDRDGNVISMSSRNVKAEARLTSRS